MNIKHSLLTLVSILITGQLLFAGEYQEQNNYDLYGYQGNAKIPQPNEKYPIGPDEILTPGDVCDFGKTRRYPEGITYCERDVHTELKREIIKEYDRERNFKIQTMDRQKFKIDHYIPLCMGGSNEKVNLWPQHESVYVITDSLEQQLCEKMAAGQLIQVKAIELIKKAKNDLSSAQAILHQIDTL